MKRGAWVVCRLYGGFGKIEVGGVFEGAGGWYPNANYEICNNFNYDIVFLMPMSSLLISNKKLQSDNWLAANNNFWCCQELKM